MKYILGISAFYHDSAACLIQNGEIIAAAQEERFTRIKGDSSFPSQAIMYCLKEANINFEDLDKIIFYEKPFLKFIRILKTYLSFAPKGFVSFIYALPIWIKNKIFQKYLINRELSKLLKKKIDNKLLFSEHHLSHAASAFFPSPFNDAAILTIDGVGEFATTSISIGKENNISILKEIHFPHSLGLLYSAFTYHLGFKVNSGEYKVMGLAPYGSPKYVDIIKNKLVKISEDGSFQLNMKYFDFATGLKMTNQKFSDLFNFPKRNSEEPMTQKDMDMASSIQKVTEEIVIKILENVKKETNNDNLCLAGGVALNCVINGIIAKKKIFKNIWIQPAAGDAGAALGSALVGWHIFFNNKRNIVNNRDKMKGSLLGPSFSENKIEHDLLKCGAKFYKLDKNKIIENVAKDISVGKVIGWMNGRMEYGPRALGSRSIIADPRSPYMQKKLNLKIKFRESFRPFAPSVLLEHAKNWFEYSEESPYMLIVSKVLDNKRIDIPNKFKNIIGLEKLNIQRSLIPAVTHVDYSARIQTVSIENNEMYHKLISKFYEITKCPIIINTSFNVRGEPIVCTPSDAFKCFMGTDMDILSIENFYLIKSEQNKKLAVKYLNKFKLD